MVKTILRVDELPKLDDTTDSMAIAICHAHSARFAEKLQEARKVTIDVLEKELKEGKLNPIYLLYGEETYLLENVVKKIKKLFGEIQVRYKLYYT